MCRWKRLEEIDNMEFLNSLQQTILDFFSVASSHSGDIFQNPVILGLCIIFIGIPLFWLVITNFGKVLVFFLALLGIVIVCVFGWFWYQLLSN